PAPAPRPVGYLLGRPGPPHLGFPRAALARFAFTQLLGFGEHPLQLGAPRGVFSRRPHRFTPGIRPQAAGIDPPVAQALHAGRLGHGKQRPEDLLEQLLLLDARPAEGLVAGGVPPREEEIGQALATEAAPGAPRSPPRGAS